MHETVAQICIELTGGRLKNSTVSRITNSDHRRGSKRRASTEEGTAGVLMLIGRLKSRSRLVSPLTSCQSNFRRILARACLWRTFCSRRMKVKLNLACTRYVFSPAGRRSLRTFVVCTYMSRSPSIHACCLSSPLVIHRNKFIRSISERLLLEYRYEMSVYKSDIITITINQFQIRQRICH